jgi:2-iminobutanoate/2-iminopropanoate deaminase
MPRQIIQAADAPSSPLFSQAVRGGPMLYVSGMMGLDPRTRLMAGESIQAQTSQALSNCEEVLRAAGATKNDVVDVQVLLSNPADFAGMNEAYAAFFDTAPPARSVAKLGVDVPGVLVSIRMTAFMG